MAPHDYLAAFVALSSLPLLSAQIQDEVGVGLVWYVDRDGHGAGPVGVAVDAGATGDCRPGDDLAAKEGRRVAEAGAHYGKDNLPALIAELEAQMREAATNLDFETAARIRDELFEVKAKAGRQAQESRGSLAGLHGR